MGNPFGCYVSLNDAGAVGRTTESNLLQMERRISVPGDISCDAPSFKIFACVHLFHVLRRAVSLASFPWGMCSGVELGCALFRRRSCKRSNRGCMGRGPASSGQFGVVRKKTKGCISRNLRSRDELRVEGRNGLVAGMETGFSSCGWFSYLFGCGGGGGELQSIFTLMQVCGPSNSNCRPAGNW